MTTTKHTLHHLQLTIVGSCIIRKKSTYSHTGKNRINAKRPRTCNNRKWWMPVSLSTFFDRMFCRENPSVADNAQISPSISNDSSVMVAIATPVIIGTKLKYTDVACFSLKKILVKITVNNGIVAFTADRTHLCQSIAYARRVKRDREKRKQLSQTEERKHSKIDETKFMNI